MTTTPTVYTIGHSNKSFEEFAALLTVHDIGTVLDARSYPKSRWPWFNSGPLLEGLRIAGIRYEPRGSNIGGKGRNMGFESTLDEIVKRATDLERIAIMCSEGDYRGCHRWTMLTPPLLQRGVRVQHIRWGGLASITETPEEQAVVDEHPALKDVPLF